MGSFLKEKTKGFNIPMNTKNWLVLLGCIALCHMAGVVGSVFTTSTVGSWYAELARPALAPPGWVIGLVWMGIFTLMGISLFLVVKNRFEVNQDFLSQEEGTWNRYSERLWTGDWRVGNIIAVFVVQLILNALWSVVFFGMMRPDIAFFELLALWFSILYTIANFFRVSRVAAWLLLPYLLWVSFAGYLNFEIWMLNR